DTDIIDEHIRHTVDLMLERSRLLSDQVASGDVAIVGLGYALTEGNARIVTTHGDVHTETAEAGTGPASA
ncbi:hypothetical protein ACFT0G_34460, partial [Streptomyces sp. NPDC057020]